MINWPQGNLTTDEWQELLAIEYTITHYPSYYIDEDYNKAVDRLQELRMIRENV